VAERQLPKLNVAGSIPVSRSIDPPTPLLFKSSQILPQCNSFAGLMRNAGSSLLGQFGVVLEGLGFGQEGDGLGDLRVPLG
jgi:hypothetical protein